MLKIGFWLKKNEINKDNNKDNKKEKKLEKID